MDFNCELEEECAESTQTVGASAPPFPVFHIVPGYEETPTDFLSECIHPLPVEFINESSPPPSYEEVVRNQAESGRGNSESQTCINSGIETMNLGDQSQDKRALMISEEDAIEALSKYVSSSCCYGRSLPKQIKAKKIQPSHGYQYILKTFYEERSTSWKKEPYVGQILDISENCNPPTAWNIFIPPPHVFQQREISKEIPYTASIKECSNCKGDGYNQCEECNGTGDTRCGVCDGLGLIHHPSQDEMSTGLDGHSRAIPRTCHHCSGGKKNCNLCSGSGNSSCSTCQGNGRLKVYLLLTVKWKVLHAQKVFKRSKLPDSCIASASGTTVFEEQNHTVCPLLDFPVDEVNSFSRKMISNHIEHVQHGRIIMQRHFVREIAVAEILTEWKKKEFTYWVYGKERHVYCPDYPAKCSLL